MSKLIISTPGKSVTLQFQILKYALKTCESTHDKIMLICRSEEESKSLQHRMNKWRQSESLHLEQLNVHSIHVTHQRFEDIDESHFDPHDTIELIFAGGDKTTLMNIYSEYSSTSSITMILEHEMDTDIDLNEWKDIVGMEIKGKKKRDEFERLMNDSKTSYRFDSQKPSRLLLEVSESHLGIKVEETKGLTRRLNQFVVSCKDTITKYNANGCLKFEIPETFRNVKKYFRTPRIPNTKKYVVMRSHSLNTPRVDKQILLIEDAQHIESKSPSLVLFWDSKNTARSRFIVHLALSSLQTGGISKILITSSDWSDNLLQQLNESYLFRTRYIEQYPHFENNNVIVNIRGADGEDCVDFLKRMDNIKAKSVSFHETIQTEGGNDELYLEAFISAALPETNQTMINQQIHHDLKKKLNQKSFENIISTISLLEHESNQPNFMKKRLDLGIKSNIDKVVGPFKGLNFCPNKSSSWDGLVFVALDRNDEVVTLINLPMNECWELIMLLSLRKVNDRFTHYVERFGQGKCRGGSKNMGNRIICRCNRSSISHQKDGLRTPEAVGLYRKFKKQTPGFIHHRCKVFNINRKGKKSRYIFAIGKVCR